MSAKAEEPADSVLVRDYCESDLEAMFQLDQICFVENFRFDRWTMRRYAESRNALAVVAEHADKTLAGFAIVHLERADQELYGYVVTLDVAPDERRRGRAAELVGTLERQARAEGAVRMDLHVFVENAAAIRFYERSGYVAQGRLTGFYGVGLDALAYSKLL